MGAIIKEIWYRIRRLSDRSGFAVASTLSLPVGIGACAVIFSIVNAVLLRQLPYPKPNQIVEVKQVKPDSRRTNLCDSNFDPEVDSTYE